MHGNVDLIPGAGHTCAGTVWKSSQRDLESTAISAPPGGISGHNGILEHGKYMYRWHSNYPEFQMQRNSTALGGFVIMKLDSKANFD